MTAIITAIVQTNFALLHQICLHSPLCAGQGEKKPVKWFLCLVMLAIKMYSLPFSSSLGDLRQMGRGGVTEILPGVKRRMKQTTSTVARQ